MSIHLNDVLFYAGGECLQKFGVPVWGMNRRQRVAPMFTRSGTVGPFTGRDGVLRAATADRIRADWLDTDADGVFDTPTFVLELARTNLVGSDNFDAGWTSVGTPVVTASIADPAGGTGAYRIADDAAGAAEGKVRTVTFTGDGVKSVVFVVREATMPASGVQSLQLYDVTATTLRLVLAISAWSSGTPTVAATTGTYLGKRYVGNGYWEIYGKPTSVTAANTNQAEIYPASTAGETGSIDVYRVNAYNDIHPGLSILDASETRALDTWYANYLHVPQEMTGYVKIREGMYPTWDSDYRILQIGNAGSTGKRLTVFRPSGGDLYSFEYHDGTSAYASTADVNPTFGSDIEIRLVWNSTGTTIIGVSKDAGTETVGSTSSAPSAGMPTSFADTRLYLNHPTGPGFAHFFAVKLVAGVRTMDEMRALFQYQAAA